VAEFLRDERHHLAVAIEDETVVGFASGVHYVHPDKPAELWINEVGVAPSHHRRGIGKPLLQPSSSVRSGWVVARRGCSPIARIRQRCVCTLRPEVMKRLTIRSCSPTS
jgi:aminoglycoside 6'-N-acetyltransferase I